MAETNKNPGSKIVPITLDGEGPISDQAEKEVEKELEAPHPTVTELNEKMAKLQAKITELERQRKRVIEIAGGHLKRAEDAESLLEKKSEVLKEIMKEKEELEKKLIVLKGELVEEKKRVNDLTRELDEERRRANEKNRLLLVSEKEKEVLEKKVIELTKEKEEFSEERKRLLDGSEKEKEELRRRLMEMEKKMNEMNRSVPIVNDEPVDGNEKRAELREESGEEPIKRTEMGEQIEDPFDDNSMDMHGLDGMDYDMIENEDEEGDTADHPSNIHQGHDNGEKNLNADVIEGGGGTQTADHIADITKDSSETVDVEKRRRSSRNVTRSVMLTYPMEESDDEVGPSVKKRRSESVVKQEKVVPQKKISSYKRDAQSGSLNKDKMEMDNDEKNELECPECEYRSRNVSTWITHLRDKHSTTPTLADCLLHCDCGHESFSVTHTQKCDISNFTIIRKGDGTIRRLTDTPATPQCVLCKEYPKTVSGYTNHLDRHHKSTLRTSGVYLKCECGFRVTSRNFKDHDKECTGREFTLHKLEED